MTKIVQRGLQKQVEVKICDGTGEEMVSVETSLTGNFTYIHIGLDGHCLSREETAELIEALQTVMHANLCIREYA